MHIQMDTTTSNCKNLVTFAICAWLVAIGRCMRVHLFFLVNMGHTHIIIDQIFGVITKACLRGR
jgi:hypothetical protein